MPWRYSATAILLKKMNPSSCTNFIDRPYNYKLLMQRRGGGISRAGMYTFPGGVHEPCDIDLRETVFREVFEETGILLCDRHSPKTFHDEHYKENVMNCRSAVHKDANQFRHILSTLNSSLRFDSAHHYCTFLTPDFETRRYITAFFLLEVSDSDIATLKADGSETASLTWITPDEGVILSDAGRLQVLPPQYIVMKELQEYDTIDKAINSLKKSSKTDYSVDNILNLIDARGYPAMQPKMISKTSISDTNNSMILTLPYDESHPQHCGNKNQRYRINCQLPIGSPGYEFKKNLLMRII